jgi:hypothetical protein
MTGRMNGYVKGFWLKENQGPWSRVYREKEVQHKEIDW